VKDVDEHVPVLNDCTILLQFNDVVLFEQKPHVFPQILAQVKQHFVAINEFEHQFCIFCPIDCP
jgi:hypothetical protein